MAQVTLDPLDLKSEHQKLVDGRTDQADPTSEVTFAMLDYRAQQLVRAAGYAVFYSWDRLTYRRISAPKE